MNMFNAGDKVKVLEIANVRHTPGFSNKDQSDVFAAVHPGEVLTVISGPHEADGLDWYECDVDGDVNGFIAEAAHGETILAADDGGAAHGGGTQPHAVDGGLASPISGGPFNRLDVLLVKADAAVHDAPDGAILGQFEAGQGVVILSGPEQAAGRNWYKVGGIVIGQGETIGYCAQEDENGAALLDVAPFTVASPCQGMPGCAQLFGENPALYAQFGYRCHVGLDFAVSVGTPLFALDDGHIEHAGWDDTGFGNMVKIVFGWGEAIYGHLSQLDVNVGQQVTKGQHIGLSGDTGFSGGPHLHLQCRFNPWHYDNGFGGCSDFWPYLPHDAMVIPGYVMD